MKQLLPLVFVLTCCISAQAQFTHADSLRGGYGSGRNWWDLVHYELDVAFDATQQAIAGSNTIQFRYAPQELSETGRPHEGTLQIDLQEPLLLDSVQFYEHGTVIASVNGQQLPKEGYAYFITPPAAWSFHTDSLYTFRVYYHGKPRVAVKAPWDGGVVWSKDKQGNPWITIACQGLGASVWYPCKDTQADEVEGARMHFSCDPKLVCVSNGHFLGKTQASGKATYSWEVKNPINNYCIIPYIGDYVNLHEHYAGEKGMLEVDYWVLRGNERRAAEHFTDVPKTLEALEYWFGPYPFYEDGYKLIEAPHLGMEHQGAIAYGNGFKQGYAGNDLSGTGEGFRWDFIIVHESGHEWFGNNITTKDIADMWVHEGFTDYSETLFTEYWFGKPSAGRYIIGLRRNILNDKPIIGPYGVNTEGSGDMYYKGANMLHTIRQIVANDSLFRGMLRGLNATFYHQTVTTQQIEQYMSNYLQLDLHLIFDQYLRRKNPPVLELVYGKKSVKYRWVNVVKGFRMPVLFSVNGWLTPTAKWQRVRYDQSSIRTEAGEEIKSLLLAPQPDKNFYIVVRPREKSGFKANYMKLESD